MFSCADSCLAGTSRVETSIHVHFRMEGKRESNGFGGVSRRSSRRSGGGSERCWSLSLTPISVRPETGTRNWSNSAGRLVWRVESLKILSLSPFRAETSKHGSSISVGNQWTRGSTTLDSAGKATVNRLPIGCMACATYNRDLTNRRRRHWWKPARNMERGGNIDGRSAA